MRFLSRFLINVPGWRTNRKIVVFESDDWGSIRMPSKKVFDRFKLENATIETNPYCRFDSLASNDDIELLFSLLLSHKDGKGNHPILTANTVVGNPVFEKILQSGFHEYFFEPFTDTLERYPKHSRVFKLWQQGMGEGVFHPQYHGREHLNVPYWLRHLSKNHKLLRLAFDQAFWGLPKTMLKEIPVNLQASYDTEFPDDASFHKKSIEEGLQLFNTLFGYNSESFIANNFIWSEDLNNTLSNGGIKYLQGMKYQKLPVLKNQKRVLERHYLGQVNELGQRYLIRNCTFEPSQTAPAFDNVRNCLNDIGVAFLLRKPAIVMTHRLNFVGFIDESNRDRNLRQLDFLIRSIIKKWPEVEFMTSDQLGRLLVNQ
jgi:hypothetical protein